ncbi:3-methyl-2-oxobutanoate hydroxymethyltransferase [Roseibium sp. HPY-6]|uniref:3-methyl-2-oxobutanoate hydroxymethyltransferase n=1 Tax=Roseibium sp. HPY-6 TaxID=3229852 RepID=UPI00338FE627
MLRVESLEEAEAASKAGIDMASAPEALVAHRSFRDAAPDLFTVIGEDFWVAGHGHDYIRWAYKAYSTGADAVYCCASPKTIGLMTDDGLPVCGHLGLIPQKMTWTGGFKAVGKDLPTAELLVDQLRQLETAGAFAAEVEVVPGEVARVLTENTDILMISMGSGDGCDGQYLYTCDVLGENTGHVPRHSKVYRNFAAERQRLQESRIEAFKEYRSDVIQGKYPEPRHVVGSDPEISLQVVELLKKDR